MNKQEVLTVYRSPAEVENIPTITPKQAVQLVKVAEASKAELIQNFWKETVEPKIKENASQGRCSAYFGNIDASDVNLLIKHAKKLGWRARKGFSGEPAIVVEWEPVVKLQHILTALGIVAIFIGFVLCKIFY